MNMTKPSRPDRVTVLSPLVLEPLYVIIYQTYPQTDTVRSPRQKTRLLIISL